MTFYFILKIKINFILQHFTYSLNEMQMKVIFTFTFHFSALEMTTFKVRKTLNSARKILFSSI